MKPRLFAVGNLLFDIQAGCIKAISCVFVNYAANFRRPFAAVFCNCNDRQNFFASYENSRRLRSPLENIGK